MLNNLKKFKQAVDTADIISFDIFDTLIMRLLSRPQDIFAVMEHKTGIAGFARAREEQQELCSRMCEQVQGVPHCTFNDIYDYMRDHPAVDTGSITFEELKQLELDTEKRFLVRSEQMYEIYRYAKDMGKRVIAISDMYLGEEEVLPLLENCGYTDIDRLYVSADIKKTKHRSDLFDYVVDEEQTAAYRILHIGDNLTDDVANAQKCGLHSMHYNCGKAKECLTLCASIGRGTAEFLALRENGFWYDLGARVGGLIYCGMAQALRARVQSRRPDKLFFLSRDGYGLFKLNEKLGFAGKDCTYLHTSRRAMLLCGIDKLDNEALALLPPFTFGQSVKDILAYADLSKISIDSVKKAGFSSFDDTIKTKDDMDKFKKIFIAEKDLVLEKAAKERAAFENYLKNIGFMSSNALVFDCGWNGSSQYLLDRALALMDYEGSNSFLYVGLSDSRKCRRQLKNKDTATVLFDGRLDNREWKKLKRSIVLLELFFGAPHNAVWKYTDNINGFAEDKFENDHTHKTEILRGITDLVETALPLLDEYGLEPDTDDCLTELYRLIEHPTEEEAVKIGDLENVDGFAAKAGAKKYIAKLTKGDITAELNELYWPQAIYARPDISDEVKNFVKARTGVKARPAPRPAKARRPNVIKRVVGYIRGYGVATTAYLIKNKLSTKNSVKAYSLFIKNTENDILKTTQLEYRPLFSFVVPVYNVASDQLRACIDSILAQTYDNFELILADDCSDWENVKQVLEEYKGKKHVKIIYRRKNGHISRCTNTCIDAAKGEYLIFADCDDTVAPNAVYEMTKAVNADKTLDLIYSDEDKLDENGKRCTPHFKPDWSPDTLMSLMYTGHLAAYRTSIVKQLGGLRSKYDGAQDYDLTLRFTEKTDRICHIPKILYHWRIQPGSIAADMDAKPYVKQAMLGLKQQALERRGLDGDVVYVPQVSQYRVVYKAANDPLVNIIIPSKDNFAVFERCINTLTEKTEYKNYKIIVVDNGSNDVERAKYAALCEEVYADYLYEEREFNFSYMCNKGAAEAKGEYLLFLNDDIEITNGGWLSAMLGQASLEHVGAVGAKLLYPDSSTIQHCGVVNFQIGPGHVLVPMDDNEPLAFCRNKLDYNYIAVTAACLMIKKDKFDKLGGFDENFAVSYNDVDLCFRLYEAGYYNVVRTDAVLYHHESVSRGLDGQSHIKQKRLGSEMEKLYTAHPDLKGRDPFYNVNLTKNKATFDIDTSFSDTGDKIISAGIDTKRYTDRNVKFALERVNAGDLTEVTGWAYIEDMPFNNLNKCRLLLENEDGKAVAVETHTVLRPDISAAFGKNGSLNLSGFSCSVNTSQLAPGTYKLGVLLENRLTLKKTAAITERSITVEN